MGVRGLGRAFNEKGAKKGRCIRNSRGNPEGEAEGRERSRKIGEAERAWRVRERKGRQSEGEEERGEWVGSQIPPVGNWGTGTPCREELRRLEVLGGIRFHKEGEKLREGRPGHWEGVTLRPLGDGGCTSSERPSGVGVLWAALGAAGKAWGLGRSP